MNISELEERTGQTARQIRFLISEGFIPAPEGGRKNAQYGDEHIAAIEEYQKLRDLGLAPKDIKTVLRELPRPEGRGFLLR